MKYQQAPKWLLTTALLAVLGANYGFQTNSLALHQDDGLFELSSETPDTGKTVEFRREGQVVATGTCADGSCKSVVLDVATLENFAQSIASTVKPLSSISSSTVVSETSDYDCDFTEDDKPETRAQRRDRLRCIKQEKEREKREERIANFEDKMEDVKDRCDATASESKLECLTREFNSALNRYSGRNALPQNIVQRYFKNVVGGELAKSLFNPNVDQQTAMTQLQDVFDSLPSEYSEIKQNVLKAIQSETKSRSQAINQQYQLADSYAKQNKSQEFLQAMNDAQSAQSELNQMAEVYSAAARTSDSFSQDISFAKYYQQTYIPSMRQIFATMGSVTAIKESTPKVEDDLTRQNTRSSTRAESSTRSQVSAPSLKVNEQPSQWEFLNSATGVRVGNPSNTSRGNTRGARSM